MQRKTAAPKEGPHRCSGKGSRDGSSFERLAKLESAEMLTLRVFIAANLGPRRNPDLVRGQTFIDYSKMDLICRSTISMSEKSKKTYSDYGSICLLIRCWQCTYRQLLWPISAISFFGFFRQRKRTPSRYIFASLFKYNLCSNKWRDMNAYGWLVVVWGLPLDTSEWIDELR